LSSLLRAKKWVQLPTTLPDAKAGHISFEHNQKLYIYGGFSGDGGFDNHMELHCHDIATNKWEECDVSGTFPRVARALSCVVYKFLYSSGGTDCFVYIFGGSDGKNPLGLLLCLSLTELKWKPVKMWLELTGNFSFSSTLSTTQNFLPIPRYGHSMVFNEQEGIITVFGGSGSTFLDDMFQIILHNNE